jgi:hypothetical protein
MASSSSSKGAEVRRAERKRRKIAPRRGNYRDKDRAVRRMGYAWSSGGQVARAVRRELPLGGGHGQDQRSAERTPARSA